MTFQEAIELHCNSGNIKASSAGEYLRLLRNHLEQIATSPVADIDTEQLLSAYRRILSKSQAQALKMLAMYSAARKVAYAHTRDPKLERDLVASVRILTKVAPPPPRLDKFLTQEQVFDWWRAAEYEEPPIKQLLQLGLLTGLRRGELLELTWDEVDLANGLITLSGKRTKSGRELIKPLGSKAKRILTTHRLQSKQSKYVFPGQNPLKPLSNPKRAFERIQSRCGIAVSMHPLRRTYITLARTVENVDVVAQLVGHSGSRITDTVYNSGEINHLRLATQRIEDVITRACEHPGSTHQEIGKSKA